jgi:hypothetical protein
MQPIPQAHLKVHSGYSGEVALAAQLSADVQHIARATIRTSGMKIHISIWPELFRYKGVYEYITCRKEQE